MFNNTPSTIGKYATTPRLSDAELVAIFPQAKRIVPALIKELTVKREDLVQYIGNELAAIKAQRQDEAYRHFWRLWLMLNEGEELQETEHKLARLQRLQNIIDGKPAQKGMLSDDLIEAARAVPIADVVGAAMRRSGMDFVCLCPLHDDHNPSMRIYREQNRAWCYSCNDGGDSIKLYMDIHGCDFKTAVTELGRAA